MVSARQAAASDVHSRIERSGDAQIQARFSLLTQRSPHLRGARVAYSVGLGVGREEPTGPSFPEMNGKIKDAVLQHILRSLGEGAE